MTAARTGFARDFLVYGRFHRPPAIECPLLEIDHGLAEDGWWRRLAGLDQPMEEEVEPAAPADDGDWSVHEWMQSMAKLPTNAARKPALIVPSVLSQAYALDRERLGILLINLQRGEAVPVDVPIDPASCGLGSSRYRVERVTAEGRRNLGHHSVPSVVSLELPSWEFVLIEASPAAGADAGR
jgi:hypothetical protein